MPLENSTHRPSRLLARSLYRDMRQNGYVGGQILALATELIDLVTKEMRGDSEVELPAAVPSRSEGLRSVG